MFTLNDTRINIYAKFTDPVTGEYGIDLTIPENRERFGIVEVADPVAPEDYSDKLYYRTEQDTAPFVVYTRKSDEQIDAANYYEGMAKIKAMEAEELMPRTLREFLLEQPGAVQKGWYAKVLALDNSVAAIKAVLPPKPVEPNRP